jgi:methylenetetrahydrofolate dehydrogenase (NADP+)/methenyltetrahydrofolate cyclohydrolase
MKLLYGKPVAEKILSRLKSDIVLCDQKPGLAVILVGDDKASHIYVNLKEKKAHEIGMNFFRHDFSQNSDQSEILNCIKKLNADTAVHGIIVQLPLPEGFETQKIINSINPEKDADGFHPANAELFLQGVVGISPVFPRAIMYAIESSEEILSGKRGIVVANSEDFGGIMCAMLESKKITSQYVLAENLSSNNDLIKNADIVVSAMGAPGLLKGEMFKNGAIIVDGGIEEVGNKVLGDVDFASTQALSGYITPVPGGVGPLTIACLLENTLLAFKAQQKEKRN